MEKTFADFLTRQRAALKAEATALTTTADKDTDGKLTAEQDVRFKAIEADIASIDAQLATAQRTAETPEQVADRVRAEIADVSAVCALAGKPARAADFIKAATPLAEVVSTLQAERAKVEEPTLSRNGGKPGADANAKPIPTATEIYAKRAKARGG
jgi:hypothetical protein